MAAISNTTLLRRAADRLRGGPDAPGGAGRDGSGRCSDRTSRIGVRVRRRASGLVVLVTASARSGSGLISFLRTPPRLVDRGMNQSGVRMRHRGTDVAIVACLFLGGSALSMIPLGLLSSLVSPMDIPPWRTGAVLAGALVVGAGMLSLARFLRRGSGWARPVGIAVLAACTLAIGLFTFTVATSPDAGDGAGYALLGGLQVGGFTLAGCIGLATRGSAADFRSLTDRPS